MLFLISVEALKTKVQKLDLMIYPLLKTFADILLYKNESWHVSRDCDSNSPRSFNTHQVRVLRVLFNAHC